MSTPLTRILPEGLSEEDFRKRMEEYLIIEMGYSKDEARKIVNKTKLEDVERLLNEAVNKATDWLGSYFSRFSLQGSLQEAASRVSEIYKKGNIEDIWKMENSLWNLVQQVTREKRDTYVVDIGGKITLSREEALRLAYMAANTPNIVARALEDMHKFPPQEVTAKDIGITAAVGVPMLLAMTYPDNSLLSIIARGLIASGLIYAYLRVADWLQEKSDEKKRQIISYFGKNYDELVKGWKGKDEEIKRIYREEFGRDLEEALPLREEEGPRGGKYSGRITIRKWVVEV